MERTMIEKRLKSHPFIVSPLLRNHIVQTVGLLHLPYFKVKNWVTERKYIDLPDRTKLGADCIFQPDYKKKSTVIVLDGYLGSSNSRFSLGIGHKAYHYGFNVILLNQRGQGDTVHLTKSLSDSGLLGDVGFALDEFVKWGCERLYIVGFSWGGSLALLELGKQGKRFQRYIKGLALISVPIDIINYSHHNESKKFSFFNWFFIKEMDKWVKRRIKIDPPGTWEESLKKKKKSVRQWDEAFMHAWGNFKTVDEYYERVNQLPLIPYIQIPTLTIHSYDEQFVPADQFKASEFKNNSQFITLLTQYGAHGGFVTAKKRYGDLDRHWAQNRALEFFRLLRE